MGSRSWDRDELMNLLYLLYAFMLPLSRAGVSLFTVLILLLFLLDPRQKAYMTELWKMPAAKWILIFVGYYFLSPLLTVRYGQSVEQWREQLRYLLPYLDLLPAVVIAVTLKKQYLVRLLYAFLAGMFVSEIFSYLIFFEIWEKKRTLVSVSNPTPFMHHIQYSTFLALTALLLLDKLVKEAHKGYRLFSLSFLLMTVGTLFLINGRTGQVAFLAGLFVLAFVQFRNKFKALVISMLLAVLVIGAAYTLSENFRERVQVAQSDIVSMLEKNDYQTSLGYRVGVTILSAPLIREHPLLGTGVVRTMHLIREEARVRFPNDHWLDRSNHLQNQYLQVLVETGMIGLGILLMLFYNIGKIPLHSENCRNLKVIFLTVYLLSMFSDIQLHIQFTAGFFALIVGLLLACARTEEEESVPMEVEVHG